MFQCSAIDCKIWLHDDCIIDDALSRTYEELVANADAIADQDSITVTGGKGFPKTALTTPARSTKSKSKPKSPMTSSALKGGNKDYAGVFSAAIDQEDDKSPVLRITDLRTKGKKTSWEEKISCLKCHKLLA